MADTAAVDPSVLLPQLIAENAELKLRIGLPEHECVLQSVLQDQLQRFFDDARRVLDVSVSQAVGLDATEAERPPALMESLRVLSRQNESLLRELMETHATRVVALSSQVDALTAERDALLSRVRALEDESAAATAPPALLCELRGLRASESALRAGLESVSARGAAAVAAAEALAHRSADAALALPPLLERLAALRESLCAAAAARDVWRLQLREAEARAALSAAAERARLLDETVAAQKAAAAGLAEGAAARGLAERAAARAAAAEAELAALREEKVEERAEKRRRLDAAAAALPADSVRREALDFWRDGRAELERLRGEREQWRQEREQWRAGKARLQRLERARGAVVGKIAGLAEELDRARDEAREIRAQWTGVAVERDFLRASLADVLAGEMQEAEVARAAQCIREAAAARPGGNGNDPQCAQELEKRREDLCGEVARLERRREKLQKCIAVREERITALHTQEAVLRIDSGKKTNNEGEKDEKGKSRTADEDVCLLSGALTVEQTVSLAQAKANDALIASAEENAEGSSCHSPVLSCVALQHAVLSLDTQLRACRSALETTEAERDTTRAQLHATETELRGSLDACNAALASTLERNASLSRSSTSLRESYKALQERYSAAASLAQRFAAALSAVLALHRAGTEVTAALHNTLQDERAVSAELTRRAAAAFDAPGTEVDRVVAALQRVGEGIAQAMAQRERGRAAAEAAHVRALSDAVQRQDERLRALHKGFAEECRALGGGVAQRITEAVRAGDGEWHARVAQIAKERDALQAQLAAERDIIVGMQHTLSVQQSDILRNDNEEEDEEKKEVEGEREGGGEDEEGQRQLENAEGSEVLKIIETLLASVSRPGEPHSTAEIVSHAVEEENKDEGEEQEVEEQKSAYGEEDKEEEKREGEETEEGTHEYEGEEKSPEA